MDRFVLLGLDGLDCHLIFSKFWPHLPNLRALALRGQAGPLYSCYPPITIPAWTTLVTGYDPGTLGVYGFTDRANHSYTDRRLSTQAAVHLPCLWHYLAAAHIESRWLAIPQTYPPPNIPLAQMVMIAGHPYPPASPPATSPKSYPVQAALQAAWQVDHLHYRHQPQEAQVTAWQAHSAGIVEQLRYWLIHEPQAQFIMAVDMGPDRLHHLLWQEAFPHPANTTRPPSKAYATLLGYYQWWDQQLGALMELLHPQDTLLLISDHGAQAMEGGFLLNQWLEMHGWLTLRTPAQQGQTINPNQVDWQKTLAWADGGFVGRVYLNVVGREPQGLIAPQDIPKYLEQFSQALEGWGQAQQPPVQFRISSPQQIYQQVHGIPPDLLIEVNHFRSRVLGTLGYPHPDCWRLANDRGPDGANHAPQGVYMLQGPGIIAQSRPLSIYDIAPSILHHFALPCPQDMRGEIGFARSHGPCHPDWHNPRQHDSVPLGERNQPCIKAPHFGSQASQALEKPPWLGN